jgi:hypothetical protein
MTIDKNKIENYKSEWGNHFNEITIEDLVDIFQGKVLYLNDGEYSNFIYLEDENVRLEHDPVTMLRSLILGGINNDKTPTL